MDTRLAVVAVAAVVAAVGCDDGLSDAIEEVRAAAPDVCKDFCEDRVTCEWTFAEGDHEEDAFGAAIHRCVIDCAWYVSRGAYVISVGSEGVKEYVDRVAGSDLEEALDCAFYAGAFRCAEEDGIDVHLFSPPVESICEPTGECMQKLGIDYLMEWNSATSTCDVSGSQTVETMFF